MSSFLKTLIGLAVALPLAAFVAGSLVVGSEDSPPRERIIIEDHAPVGTDGASENRGREQGPSRKPPVDDDRADGPDDDTDGDERDDDSRAGSSGGAETDDDLQGR